jgi:hypothetical protein
MFITPAKKVTGKLAAGRLARRTKATESVPEVLFRLLHASCNAEERDYWVRCKDRHYRWEAFKLAQAYMFGKPVQPVASEELAPPIKIDISASPKFRVPAS